MKTKIHKYIEISADEILEKFDLKGKADGFSMSTVGRDNEKKTVIRFDLHE